MVVTLGRNENIMKMLTWLYHNEQYVDKLKQIKNRMRNVANSVSPQFDDIEAEITCLILMDFKPNVIHEFLSYYGWSTLYMLNAVDIGGLSESRIHSYGFHNHHHHAIIQFPELMDKLTVTYGDVAGQFSSVNEIDYLFIDSNHDQDFAQKYIDQLLVPLLEKLKQNNKRVFVSIHDVFHAMYETNYEFSGESKLLMQFLRTNGICYFSPQNFSHKKKIAELRAQSGLDQDPVNCQTTNSSIFFILGKKQQMDEPIAKVPLKLSNITLSSQYPGEYPGLGGAEKLLDGNPDTYAHTGAGEEEFIRIDLDKEIPINEIHITNRKDCCQNRMNDTKLICLSAEGKIVNEIDIQETKMKYQFMINNAVTKTIILKKTKNNMGENRYINISSILVYSSISIIEKY